LTISISASVLSSYYAAQEGVLAATKTNETGSSSASKAAPTPPWESTSTAPQQSALVTSVLNGGKFFTSGAAQLSSPSGTNQSDYSNLFSLYQGINALQGLAADAGASGVTAAQQASYAQAFSTGLSQLQTFISQANFSTLKVSAGTVTASEETTVGTPQESDTYTTGTLYSGPSDGVVPAFQGDIAFSVNLASTSGPSTTVNFNLDDMGSTPRTMANVINYLNGQLSAAGVTTRFQAVSTPGTPVTTTVNGQTVDLTSPPNNYALEIVGSPTEVPTFTASSAAPSVFITAASGSAGTPAFGTTPATPGDQTQELLQFNTAATSSATAQTSNTALASTVSSALASATAPDGSVYVVANVDGTTAGQTLSGTQDVALMKYDSAGNLVYTRLLGAASGGTGYSIAVSPTGDNVAVVGSVTGGLTGSTTQNSLTAGTTTSFVAEYDSAGDQTFAVAQPAFTANAATGAAFGANGELYVTGTSQGVIPGATVDGGTGQYVQSYSASGALQSTVQFGAAGTSPAGIAVSGSNIYIAGDEAGSAVVRQFTANAAGDLSAGAQQNLGALGTGSVAGVGVLSDGSVVVAGSTTNGSLSAGAITSAYTGGQQGFVASLAANLQPSASDQLAYVNAPGSLSGVSMTVSGDQVYLAGSVAVTPPAGSGLTAAAEGYAAAVDPSSGAVTWSQTFTGANDTVAPTSISVAASGASVLDQLGLPTSITYAKSGLLTSTTGLAAGDTFSIQVGSSPAQTITIQPTDTLHSLATEIDRASGYAALATTVTVNGETQLKITPANSSENVTLISGPVGSDVLAGLGLTPGVLDANAGQTTASGAPAAVTLGLNLPAGLNLNSASAIKTAQSALALASAKIETTYENLANPTSSKAASSASANSAETTYLNARAANYQSALTWLQNNETTPSSTSLLL